MADYQFRKESVSASLIPAPPFWEDYGESKDEYEEAVQEWQAKIGDDIDSRNF
jgi:hypothetical protein